MNRKNLTILIFAIIVLTGTIFFVVEKKKVIKEQEKQVEVKKEEDEKKITKETEEEKAKQLEEQKLQQKRESMLQSPNVDTTNWKTYRDEKYKFEIKYNPKWELKKGRGGAMAEGLVNFMYDEKKQPTMISFSGFTSEKNPRLWYIDQGFGGITFDREYLVKNYLAYCLEIDYPESYLMYSYMISDKKKYLIKFNFTEKDRHTNPQTQKIEEKDNSQYLEDFKAMVYSIKFID